MRIAWFSALPISKEFEALRSAYFSKHILPLVREDLELELFHNSFEQYENFDCYHYLAAFKRHEEKPFDAFFYQLEDSPLCQFARVHALLKPGVVYFHDFVFTSFGPEPILNSPWHTIQAKFSGQELPWPQRDAKHFQDGPLANREGSFAPIAIFSNPAQHTQFRDLDLPCVIDKMSSYFLPVPVEVNPIKPIQSAGKLKVGYCGSPRIEHRAHKFLLALNQLKCPYELTWMVKPQDELQAHDLLAEFDAPNVNLVTDYSPRAWEQLVGSLDIAAHLAFSVYEQNDPYLGISLMAGLPCMVTDFGPSQALPDNIVFKIEPGESEAFQIGKVLEALSACEVSWNPELAHAFAVERYSKEAIADDLVRVFSRHRGELADLRQRWSRFEDEAKQALISETRAVANADTQKICYKKLSISRLKDEDLVFSQICEPVFKELGWL